MNQLIEFSNNHPLMMLGLMAAALAVMFNELRIKKQGLTSLSVADAIKLINNGAAVLDVRDAAVYKKGHIVDSKNVAAKSLNDAPSSHLPSQKSALLVCDNGTQSARCATDLQKSGEENVFALKGGLAAWKQENLPVVDGKK
jgi:rhodanese-related sulfurtransferase